MSSSPFTRIDGVVERIESSRRVVHQLASERRIPHRKLPGQRALLFVLDEVDAWVIDPAMPLEVVELDRGGRIVRPA